MILLVPWYRLVFSRIPDFVFFDLTQYVPGSTSRCQSPDIFLAFAGIRQCAKDGSTMEGLSPLYEE